MNRKTSITLIRCDSSPDEQARHPRHLHPALELKYIQAGILKECGVLSPIIDNWILRLTPEQLLASVSETAPAVAIIRGDSSCITESVSLGRALRKNGIITIAVGQHVSHAAAAPCPDWYDAFDISLLGEPEAESVRIVAQLAQGSPLAELRNTCSETFLSRSPVYVGNPDSLPHPMWTPTEFAIHPFPFPVRGPVVTRWGYVQTSWGCPHSSACTFCSDMVRKSSGASLRLRNVDGVQEEITHMMEHGAQAICFEDNSIMNSKSNFLRLCDRMKTSGLRFPWMASARIDQLDDENVQAAAETGAVLLKVGIESGSPRILELLGKCANGKQWLRRVRAASASLARRNIGAVGLVMVGCPDETEAETNATMSLVCELDLDYIQVQVFAVYPDSIYCRNLDAAETERYHADGNLYHYTAALRSPSRIPPERLLRIQHTIYRRFYLRPSYLSSHLQRFWRWYLHPGTAITALRNAGPKILELVMQGRQT